MKTAALRTRILRPTLISSTLEMLLLAAVFAVSMLTLKSIIGKNNNTMTNTASRMGGSALETSVKENMRRHVEDMAALIDEKLLEIENITRLISARASDFNTNTQSYKPRPLTVVTDGTQFGGDWNTYTYFARPPDRQAAAGEAAFAANISDIFKLIGHINGDIVSAYLAGESGYFLVARTQRAMYNDYRPRERPWYTAAKTAGTLAWSGLYAGISGPSITCAAPYYGAAGGGLQGGRRVLKGISGVTIALENFEHILQNAARGENTTVFLLTGAGEKLFSSDGNGARVNSAGAIEAEDLTKSDNESLRALAAAMTARESGDKEITVDGVTLHAAYHPLAKLNWNLCITMSETVITSPAGELSHNIEEIARWTGMETNRATVIMALLFALLAMLIFAYRVLSVFSLARRIAGPVRELARQVDETGAGDLTGEVTVTSQSIELIQLAGAFNRMKANLREHIETLARTLAERQKMNDELDIAAQIQQAMLPSAALPPPGKRQSGIETDAAMYPAKEVGGDLYDFFFIDGERFAVVIGDVSGKGLPAAMLMLITKTLIKTHLQDGLSVAAALNKVNAHICGDNYTGRFVTVWAGVYNTATRELEYVNAGHSMPLFLQGGENGEFAYLQSKLRDIVIGVMEGFTYHTQKLNLAPGGALFLYTDGITEAFNAEKEMYGEEHLRSFLNANKDKPLKTLLPAVYADIKTFAGGAEQSDDITMLMLRLW